MRGQPDAPGVKEREANGRTSLGTDVAVDDRLENMAAELRRHGLDVTGPRSDQPRPGGPDAGCIGVRDPATGIYAEVSLVRHAPDPGDWFLQLSYWTDRGTDPDGLRLNMAGRVRSLLCGSERSPQHRSSPAPLRPVPPAASGRGQDKVTDAGR